MAVTKATTSNRVNFASNLVRFQKVHNLSNADLAALLVISVQMISRYRSGKDFPSFDRMQQLCMIFQCTMEELLKNE